MAIDHPTAEAEDLARRYFERRLDPEVELEFEEHLATCQECQQRLEADVGLRRGFRDLAADGALRTWIQPGSGGRLGLWPRQGAAFTAGLAVAAALVLMLWPREAPRYPTAPLEVVLLDTLRGSGDTVVAIDHGQGLTLALDTGPPTAGETYRVRILDPEGNTLFDQDELEPNVLEVLLIPLPVGLEAGTYRVELTAHRGGESTERVVFRLELQAPAPTD